MSQFNNIQGKRFNLITQPAVKIVLCSLILSSISCGQGRAKSQDMRQAPAKSSAPLTKNPPVASKTPEVPSGNVESKPKPEVSNQSGSGLTTPPKLSLDGHWQTPCVKDEDGQSDASATMISGNREVYKQLKFADENCQTLILDIDVKSVFTVGLASTKVPGAYEVDRALTQVLLTPMTQEMADALTADFENNDDPKCAAIKFESKVIQDVTQCNLFPMVLYDLVKQSGELMWTGGCDDEGACETKETRATHLETTFATRLK